MTRRRAILVALLLLAVVVGISAGVGFATHGSGFDWDVASVFGTALGTTLLAVATLGLAYSTWQDVRASQRIANVTSESLNLGQSEREDRLRPAVIGTVIAVNTDLPQTSPFIKIELHNVGGGVAVRVQVTAEFADGDAADLGSETLPVLLPGTSFKLDLRFWDEPPEGLKPEDFRVRGNYRDRLGRPGQVPILDGSTTSWSPASSDTLVAPFGSGEDSGWPASSRSGATARGKDATESRTRTSWAAALARRQTAKPRFSQTGSLKRYPGAI